MAFLVFVLFLAAIGGGCTVWCWREEIECRLLGQHLRVRAHPHDRGAADTHLAGAGRCSACGSGSLRVAGVA